MVYDKTFKRMGTLGGASSIERTDIANGVGTAEVTVKADQPRVAAALAAGARLVIEDDELPPFSGPVTGRSGAGPSGPNGSSVTLACRSDLRVIQDWTAWPAPGKPVDKQGQAYATYTGNAESIAKAVLNANRGRYPERVSVAPNLNRGAIIPGGVKFRWHPIVDRLLPALEQAGLVLVAWQDGTAGVVLDVREQRVIRRELSVESGNLVSWSWTEQDPEVTRVIVGGQGQGDMRTSLQKIEPAREAAVGYAVERFIDARDTDEQGELAGRMDEALKDGAAKSGLAVELAVSAGFQYGKPFNVGDRITIDAAGVKITDILRSVTVTWTREAGRQITPKVGDASDDPDLALGRRVRALEKSQTNLKVGL